MEVLDRPGLGGLTATPCTGREGQSLASSVLGEIAWSGRRKSRASKTSGSQDDHGQVATANNFLPSTPGYWSYSPSPFLNFLILRQNLAKSLNCPGWA